MTDTNTSTPGMTEEHARQLFAEWNRAIAAGEEARQAREALIRVLTQEYGWGQVRVANLSSLSQAAVSKVFRQPGGDMAPDPATSAGRVLAVAEWTCDLLRAEGGLRRMTDKLFETKAPITPLSWGQLRKLLETDLARLGSEQESAARAALAEVDETWPGPDGVMRLSPAQQWRLIIGHTRQRAALEEAR